MVTTCMLLPVLRPENFKIILLLHRMSKQNQYQTKYEKKLHIFIIIIIKTYNIQHLLYHVMLLMLFTLMPMDRYNAFYIYLLLILYY